MNLRLYILMVVGIIIETAWYSPGCHLTDRERPETAQYEMNIRIIDNAGNIKKGMEQDSIYYLDRNNVRKSRIDYKND